MHTILPGEYTEASAEASDGITVVTGAAGFIGSHLVDLLLRQQHKVIGLDSFASGYSTAQKRANLSEAVKSPRFRLMVDDIRCADLVGLFSGADTVYHLAAQAGVQDSWQSCEQCDVNVAGTQAVLSAALEAGVKRLVLASSSSVYGETATLDGARTLKPISPYGVAKAACEQLADVYARRGLEVVVLRYFTVFGPRQRPDMAMHRLFEATRPKAAVFCRRGSGEQTREFTFVGDVVAATLAAGTEQRAAGRTFDIGGGCTHSLNEVIAEVSALSGAQASIREVPQPAGDPQATVADIGEARRVLDWRPLTNLSRGLTAQALWHQQNWKAQAQAAGRDHDPAITLQQPQRVTAAV